MVSLLRGRQTGCIIMAYDRRAQSGKGRAGKGREETKGSGLHCLDLGHGIIATALAWCIHVGCKSSLGDNFGAGDLRFLFSERSG